MPDFHIILLPPNNYYGWLGAAREYGSRFGANFTNEPASAGNFARPNQTITIVTAHDPYQAYGQDIVAWFGTHYPDVKNLDVLKVDSPEELKELLDKRVAANDPLLPVQSAPAPTPTPAPAPRPAPQPAPQRDITGTLQMKENKPSYAARIENIFFIEEIVNHTDREIRYGVIGVKVTKLTGEGQDFFHTSWSGDLKLGPRCKGPTDACGGSWNDSLRIEMPGTYRLTLDICYSPVDQAMSGNGQWETLTPGVEITVVNWTPPG